MTKTEQLFADVITTLHQRGTDYGHPIGNHKRIAELWSAYLVIQSSQMKLQYSCAWSKSVGKLKIHESLTITQMRSDTSLSLKQ